MSSYSPELIHTMRAVLDEAMCRIPGGQTAQAARVHMAGLILRAAADGETSYEGLLIAASREFSRSSFASV
jgi:hypothetical protein